MFLFGLSYEIKASECNRNVFKSMFSELSLAEEARHDIATNWFKRVMDNHFSGLTIFFFRFFLFFLFDFALMKQGT